MELNPRPKPGCNQECSICHWNVNSMLFHDYSKTSLLTAYISVQNFDLTCLSETYLECSADTNDGNLATLGYIMCHPDQSYDVKRGGVCIYYKTKLPLKVLSTNFLQAWINFKVSFVTKIFRFIHLYRPSSQSQNKFHDFFTNLEMNLNLFLTTVISDFNIKSNNC